MATYLLLYFTLFMIAAFYGWRAAQLAFASHSRSRSMNSRSTRARDDKHTKKLGEP
jgi:hypothetical protein